MRCGMPVLQQSASVSPRITVTSNRRSYEDTSMTHSRGNTDAVAMTHVGNTVHKFATGAYSNVFKQVFPVAQQQKPKPSRDYTIQFSARNKKSTLHIPPTQKLSNLHKKKYPKMAFNFPLSVDGEFDNVLTSAAIEYLRQNYLSEENDGLHQWDIKPLPFYQDPPYIKFHNNKIPKYFNHAGIFLYLGFILDVGRHLFFKQYRKGTMTRSAVLATAHDYINAKWESRTHLSTSMGTPMAETVMTEIGLSPEVMAEVNALYLEFDRNATTLQEYFDNNHDKNIENLEMVDFIHALMDLRMKKLEKLDEAVLQNRPKGWSVDN